MFRNLARAVALVAATLSLARAGETGVAARVNGVAIEAERLQRYFEDYLAEKGRNVAAIRSPTVYKSLYREALDRLVEAELLWQEAKRRKIAVGTGEVDAALDEVRAAFRRPGAFERRLESGGYTPESYREYLRRQLAIRKLVQEDVVARVSVGDGEVHAFYEANRERFVRPAQDGGAATAVPEREARDAIRERLLAEKARDALARKVQALRERGKVEILAVR
jgi:parvulin-like peptidyl-prolyl isomerase